ncbi:hypothetical protein M3Y94_01034400 [Aphelenchoides besseyi]|nr:hypothetical protein M3Y94_01034400 [Aphelenchoides besseyi]KAI6223939.1 hypothetical protein M3Y95_00829900 [Aphelenchoides besseyi]
MRSFVVLALFLVVAAYATKDKQSDLREHDSQQSNNQGTGSVSGQEQNKKNQRHENGGRLRRQLSHSSSQERGFGEQQGRFDGSQGSLNGQSFGGQLDNRNGDPFNNNQYGGSQFGGSQTFGQQGGYSGQDDRFPFGNQQDGSQFGGLQYGGYPFAGQQNQSPFSYGQNPFNGQGSFGSQSNSYQRGNEQFQNQ